jgi:hypothetical protein
MPAHATLIPDYISVSSMARQLRLSRSRLYDLIQQGVFLPPVYSVKTRRPMFPREIADMNLLVRQTHRGVDGSPVIFNQPRTPSAPPTTSTGARRPAQGEYHSGLVASLKRLGLEGVTSAQVGEALGVCYPGGTQGTEDGEVLRRVYRHLRRSVTA